MIVQVFQSVTDLILKFDLTGTTSSTNFHAIRKTLPFSLKTNKIIYPIYIDSHFSFYIFFFLLPDHGEKDAISDTNVPSTELQPRNHKQHWLIVAIYAVFVLFGQTTATLLGRLYYKGISNATPNWC